MALYDIIVSGRPTLHVVTRSTSFTPDSLVDRGSLLCRSSAIVRRGCYSPPTWHMSDEKKVREVKKEARPKPERPSSIAEYIEWAKDVLKVDFTDRGVVTMYNVNAAALHSAAQASPFFEGLLACLKTSAEEYQSSFGEQMFMSHPLPMPTILKKPYDSVVEKSFRKNVVWNKKFPVEPQGGWVGPTNWFTSMDDILRTSLVCRFLDGPETAAKALQSFAAKLGLILRIEQRSLDQGYYAHHCYVRLPAALLVEGYPTDVMIDVEIQITTQLQDVLRTLTHRYYAEDRVGPGGREWQWQFKTNRFRARFLGHSLHLLEALIVDVRDKKSEK